MAREASVDHHGNLKPILQIVEDKGESHFPQRKTSLICTLVETVQHPPIGPFQGQDLI